MCVSYTNVLVVFMLPLTVLSYGRFLVNVNWLFLLGAVIVSFVGSQLWQTSHVSYLSYGVNLLRNKIQG